MSDLVPEGWDKGTLGERCEILDSKRIPLNSEERASRVGDYPYYGANGIQGYIDGFIFDGDAILVAEDGGNFDQYAHRPIAQWVTGKYWVNNHAHILRAKGSDTNKWVFYSLVHKNILKFINGGTRAKLNQSDLREIEILIPPLPEQRKIASILTSVDDVIETTQRQIDKLQDLKKATMNELLTKGIGHTEFKNSELGRIPKSWEVADLGDFSNVTKLAGFEYTEHFDYSVGGEIIALRALNLDGGKLDLTSIQTIPKSVSNALPRSKLFYGEILISYVGSVGDLGFIYENDRFHLAPNVAKITCDLDNVNAQFILQQLLSDRVQINIKSLSPLNLL